MNDVIEVEPFGVTAGMDKSRPVMLFREKNGQAVLPVWLSPLDAGIALTQHGAQAFATSPYDVPLQALSILGIKPEACHFNEVRGNHQYVELKFSGSEKLQNLKARADHAVSFCLQAKVKFYCTRRFLDKCRDAEIEMERSEMSARRGPDSRRNRQMYLN